jgi:hypothetical protein
MRTARVNAALILTGRCPTGKRREVHSTLRASALATYWRITGFVRRAAAVASPGGSQYAVELSKSGRHARGVWAAKPPWQR